MCKGNTIPAIISLYSHSTKTIWLGVPTHAQEMQEATKRRVLTGFSGGMMLHTGYLDGRLPQVGYRAKGAPFGIGGAIRLHLGQHWMLGSEGYVSTLRQLHNGSHIRYGWGGVLGAFYWKIRRVMPFVGLTIGGGGRTSFLLFDGDAHDWTSERESVFHKQSFCIIAPFVGSEFQVAKVLHVIVKVDWVNAISSRELLMPHGPRFYVGLMFHH